MKPIFIAFWSGILLLTVLPQLVIGATPTVCFDPPPTDRDVRRDYSIKGQVKMGVRAIKDALRESLNKDKGRSSEKEPNLLLAEERFEAMATNVHRFSYDYTELFGIAVLCEHGKDMSEPDKLKTAEMIERVLRKVTENPQVSIILPETGTVRISDIATDSNVIRAMIVLTNTDKRATSIITSIRVRSEQISSPKCLECANLVHTPQLSLVEAKPSRSKNAIQQDYIKLLPGRHDIYSLQVTQNELKPFVAKVIVEYQLGNKVYEIDSRNYMAVFFRKMPDGKIVSYARTTEELNEATSFIVRHENCPDRPEGCDVG